jgi:hypothetical protein
MPFSIEKAHGRRERWPYDRQSAQDHFAAAFYAYRAELVSLLPVEILRLGLL